MRRREPLHFGQLAEQRSTLKPPDYFIPESQKPCFALWSDRGALRGAWLNDKRKRFRAPYKQIWIQKRFSRFDVGACRSEMVGQPRLCAESHIAIANRIAVIVQRMPRRRISVSQACDTLGSGCQGCFVARSIGIFDRATPQSAAGRGPKKRTSGPANREILPHCVRG